MDEDCQDLHVLEQASKVDPNSVRTESTSLTAFLHILRLRRIESSIQQTIYRVDQSTNVTDAEVELYLDQLENWKSLIPLDAKRKVDRDSVAFDGYDYYGKFDLFSNVLSHELTLGYSAYIDFELFHAHFITAPIFTFKRGSAK